MNRHPPELVEEVLNLYAMGLSRGLIAERLGKLDDVIGNIVYVARKAGDPRAGKVGERAKITKITRACNVLGGVPATVIKTIVPARFDGPRQRTFRHIVTDDLTTGVLPFGEPAPGRSALDQRAAP